MYTTKSMCSNLPNIDKDFCVPGELYGPPTPASATLADSSCPVIRDIPHAQHLNLEPWAHKACPLIYVFWYLLSSGRNQQNKQVSQSKELTVIFSQEQSLLILTSSCLWQVYGWSTKLWPSVPRFRIYIFQGTASVKQKAVFLCAST